MLEVGQRIDPNRIGRVPELRGQGLHGVQRGLIKGVAVLGLKQHQQILIARVLALQCFVIKQLRVRGP